MSNRFTSRLSDDDDFKRDELIRKICLLYTSITLGLDIGGSEVTCWDISEDALKIAQGNVALLDAGNVKIEYQDALKLAETSDTRCV